MGCHGMPEILHSPQPQNAFRPLLQSVGTQTDSGGVRQPFPRCVDVLFRHVEIDLREEHGGGIHREISQHRGYSQTHP